MKFGFPCKFITITPDDLRNFQVVVYSMDRVEYKYGITSVTDFSEQDIPKKYQIRQCIRGGFPVLCAEEYRHILKLVIKYLFQWDMAKGSGNNVSLLRSIEGWCLVTEEQGNKTLHGHGLLFVDYGMKFLIYSGNILSRMMKRFRGRLLFLQMLLDFMVQYAVQNSSRNTNLLQYRFFG